MMRWKIKRTCWGWSLFYDGDLVASADDPLALILYPAFLQYEGTRDRTRQ